MPIITNTIDNDNIEPRFIQNVVAGHIWLEHKNAIKSVVRQLQGTIQQKRVAFNASMLVDAICTQYLRQRYPSQRYEGTEINLDAVKSELLRTAMFHLANEYTIRENDSPQDNANQSTMPTIVNPLNDHGNMQPVIFQSMWSHSYAANEIWAEHRETLKRVVEHLEGNEQQQLVSFCANVHINAICIQLLDSSHGSGVDLNRLMKELLNVARFRLQEEPMTVNGIQSIPLNHAEAIEHLNVDMARSGTQSLTVNTVFEYIGTDGDLNSQAHEIISGPMINLDGKNYTLTRFYDKIKDENIKLDQVVKFHLRDNAENWDTSRKLVTINIGASNGTETKVVILFERKEFEITCSKLKIIPNVSTLASDLLDELSNMAADSRYGDSPDNAERLVREYVELIITYNNHSRNEDQLYRLDSIMPVERMREIIAKNSEKLTAETSTLKLAA